jgi:hypothetical protein
MYASIERGGGIEVSAMPLFENCITKYIQVTVGRMLVNPVLEIQFF